MRILRRPEGFTLIEILIALAIVAVLIGLMIPAVQKVRASAARVASTNNLKQMALAAHAFNGDRGDRLPDPTEPIAPGAPATAAQPWNQATGPLFQLLPYLEQGALYFSIRGISSRAAYDAVMPTAGGRAAVVRVFISPADPSNPSGQVVITRNTAVPINNGLWGTTSYSYNPLAFTSPASGLGRSFADGTSVTVLFAEKYQLCTGSTTVQNYWFGAEGGNSRCGRRSPVLTGVQWQSVTGAFAGADFLAANLGAAPTRCEPGAPSGPHPGRILVAFADGSVRALTAEGATARLGAGSLPAGYDLPMPGALAPQRGYLWSALLTPGGGETISLD